MKPLPDRNLEHALGAIGILFEPGDVIEIRALEFRRQPDHTGITYAGYFNFENQAAIQHAIRAVDGLAEGVYVVLNRLNPVLLARSNNRLKTRLRHTTTDADIMERRWLYVDADPIRPAGISATDIEHELALQRTEKIRQALARHGWPAPISCDSGNGGHLHYRLPPLPLEQAGDLIKRCLQALGTQFTDAAVKVDESTANAARICKLYGTRAGKGDSMPERPHRRSRIVDSPERIEPVSLALLQHLAAEAPSPTRVVSLPISSRTRPRREFDLGQWLASAPVEIVQGPEVYHGGRRWLLRVCPFNVQHLKPAVIELTSGAIVFKCLHQSCADNDWKALRGLFEVGYAERGSRSTHENLVSDKRSTSRNPDEATVDLRYYPHTDTGNAERLVALYGSDIRFCAETKKWLVWDGRRWNSEDARRVKALAKSTIRLLYTQALEIEDGDAREATEKHARRSESAKAINAMIQCAEYETGIQVSATDLDQHAYLLNCRNGTLDLTAGRLRAHDPADLITKLVHVDYRPDAKCPQFLGFLIRIMGGGFNASNEDRDRADRLRDYLQRCFGYALTADVLEKVVFCFFGCGNNGKTTLLEIIRFVLSEYSAQVLIDSLMAHHSRESNASLADLSDLRGARFVTTSEAEEGQRLAVAKLKYLTQGMGKIKTCRKYENPIEFPATHKLFLDANHKPVIRGADQAVFNRLKTIPFTETIPPEEIDKGLLEKLKREAEGILAWLVEGCQRQLAQGLGEPPEVAEATAAWQAESDQFPLFLSEKCVLEPDAWIPVSVPWQAYQDWCDANKERPISKATFDTRLEHLRCRKGKREGGATRAWLGIRFRTSDDDRIEAERDNGTKQDTEC